MMMIMMSSIIEHYSNQLKSWQKLKCSNKLCINVRKYFNSSTFVALRISFAKYKATINRILQARPRGIKNLFSPHVEQKKRRLGQKKIENKHFFPNVRFWGLALITNILYLSPIVLWRGLISIIFSTRSEKQSLIAHLSRPWFIGWVALSFLVWLSDPLR